jgi:hypothetical protein
MTRPSCKRVTNRTRRRTLSSFWPVLASACAALAWAPAGAADMALLQEIALADTRGRIDHLAIDLEHGRLFIAALAANAVEVVDLHAATRIARLQGRREPQGVAYVPAAQRLLVANGDGGKLEAFRDGQLQGVAADLPDADNLRLDARSGRVYAGYGRALAEIDAMSLQVLRRMPLPGHPEAFDLSATGSRVYVNVPTAKAVVVLDPGTGRTLATWSVAPSSGNFAMALDEANQRLMIATRDPASLLVLDAETGRRVAELALCGDVDDLFLDARRHQLYAVCGEGLLAIVPQRDRDHYGPVQKVATSPGARTGLFVPALDRLFVAAPARLDRPARILVYRLD